MTNYHPYRVNFTDAGGSRQYCFVLAESSKGAIGVVRNAHPSVAGVSARKQRMSKCAFYKKFGKQAAERYFGVKL